MKRFFKFLIILLPLVAGTIGWFHWSKRVSLEQILTPETRHRALHKAWLQSKDSESDVFESVRRWPNFQDYVTSIDVLPCPQGTDGDPPLYLILYKTNWMPKASPPFSSWADLVRPEKWDQWWKERTSVSTATVNPPLAPTTDFFDEEVLFMVDHEANVIERPFDGDNVADGDVFYDLNQNGYLERVNTIRFGGFTPDIIPEVLVVRAIQRQQPYLFGMVLNVEDIDKPRNTLWHFANCEDSDGDGYTEIHLEAKSPTTSPPPQVLFEWNPDTGEFEDQTTPPDEDPPYWLLSTEVEEGKWFGSQLAPLVSSGELQTYWKSIRNSP